MSMDHVVRQGYCELFTCATTNLAKYLCLTMYSRRQLASSITDTAGSPQVSKIVHGLDPSGEIFAP